MGAAATSWPWRSTSDKFPPSSSWRRWPFCRRL